ncbi:g1609 [Coccomyxa elongata]
MPQQGPNVCVMTVPSSAGETPPAAFPHLPEEIWLHIASLMSTKEWAGASGACRALHRLQLEHIDIVTTCGNQGN